MKAYFSYVNSRKGPDGKRGVYGRQIVFKYYDDGYNPANSVQLTRKLVEEDNVFAVVGSLGTEVNEAIRPYLNARKVPQILDATGASTCSPTRRVPVDGRLAARVRLEARIYGQAIARNSPNAKIAVLYQNDDFGKDNLEASRRGSGAKASNIVAAESHEVTAADVRAQIAKLRASGAIDLRHLHDAEVHDPVVRDRERAQVVAGRHLHDLGLGDRRVPDAREELGRRRPASTGRTRCSTRRIRRTRRGTTTPAMKLYKQVMAKYYPSGRVTDGLNLYGVATAEAFVQLLYNAGQEPDAGVADEGVPELEPAEPVPAPGQPAEDRRVGPAPDPVRADHQVHERDVPAGVEAEVRHGEGDVAHRADRSLREGRERSRPSSSLRPSRRAGTRAQYCSICVRRVERWTRSVAATFTARTTQSLVVRRRAR